MAEQTATVTTRSPLGGAIALFKAGFLLCALTWLAHYAYVRATTRPPGTLPFKDLVEQLVPPPAHDVSGKLLDAMSLLPPRPYGSFEVSVANFGAWDSAARPELADVIRYVELPETQEALGRVAEVSTGRCAVDGSFQQHSMMQSAALHLVARARYRWQGQADYDAAVRDLLTALNLARMFYDQPMVWSVRMGALVEMHACQEVRRMALDERVPAEQVVALQEDMASVGLPALPPVRAALQTSRRFYLASLDGYYVKGSRGGGWLDIEALGRLSRNPRSDRWPATDSLTRLGGLWNLFSPVYRPREVIEAKCARILDSVADVEGLVGSAAFEQLSVHRRLISELDELDGVLPLLFRWRRGYEPVIEQLIRATMERQATLTLLAIERYRKAHDGSPPPSLDALIPHYLSSPPLDWYADAPLRYRVDGDRYVLYSIYRNRTDEGGDHGTGVNWRAHPDFVYTADRPEPPQYIADRMVADRVNAVWPDEQPDEDDNVHEVDKSF